MAGLAAVPCALVNRGLPSSYRLRRTADPRRLATIEAIAEALTILEGPTGPAARDELLRIFDVMVERSLRVRRPVARVLRVEAGAPIPGESGDVDLGIEHARQDADTLGR
jgi:DTW domain-containing protein YfiP